jgi:uncharacterized repeat protein (TIGR03803 family)
MRILFHFVAVLTVIAAAGRAQSIVTLGNLPSDAAQIIQGSDGNFYGTALSGGDGMCQNTFRSGACGSIFEVTPAGMVSTLYSFQPGPNATSSYPYPNGVTQGTDGNFYGTTQQGGTVETNCPNGCGTIFKVTPAGSATTLYSFDQVHGSSPLGNLVEGTDGNFYGVTEYGGTGTNCIGIDDGAGAATEVGCGTIFKITPQGVLTSLHSFNLTDGATPLLLIQGTDGNFYGITQYGGAGDYCPSGEPGFLSGCGTVFKITPTGASSTFYEFEGPGLDANPTDLMQAANGSFYVIVSGINALNYGLICQLTSAGVLTTAVAFNGANGVLANSLIQGSDGNLYGTTQGEGTLSGVASQVIGGTLFQLSPTTGTLLTLYNFCALGCTQGNTITGTTVIQGNDGNLYGIANESQFFRYNLISPPAPAISANSGVVNGASFQAGIAAGSWLTINGTNLSTTTATRRPACLHRVRQPNPDQRTRAECSRGIGPRHRDQCEWCEPSRERAALDRNTCILPMGQLCRRNASGLHVRCQERNLRRHHHRSRETRRCDHSLGYRLRPNQSRRARRHANAVHDNVQHRQRRQRYSRRQACYFLRRGARVGLRGALSGRNSDSGWARQRRLSRGGDDQ